MHRSLLPWIFAVVAFGLAAARINHGLLETGMPPGPGLTIDEPINLVQSLYLAKALGQHGPMLLSPSVARQVFTDHEYLADYPPLGRLWLGMSHESFAWLIPGRGQSVYCLPAARLGTCLVFAYGIYLATKLALSAWGVVEAFLSGLGLMLVPQFIGHARLANLDMATAVMWFASVAVLCRWWTTSQPPSNRTAILSGTVWGLLMLTKMQGVLFPPVVVIWAFWRFRSRALRPLCVYALSGLAVFFLLWPWLWLDPVANLQTYLGQASERPILHVWYLGEKFADKQVPWHYPFVMLACCLPAYLVPGALRISVLRRLDPVEQILLIGSGWPLIVFAIPGIPVYDGIRLFLCVVPGCVILSVRGLTRIGSTNLLRNAAWVLSGAFLIASLVMGDVLSPFAINQYSDLIGRGYGASVLQMEACYWGDALNGEFWKQVPEDTTIMVAPVLHGVQLNGTESLVPVVANRRIHLVPFEYDPVKQKGLLLLIHRLADLRSSLRDVPEGAVVLAEVRHEGVVLARLLDTTNATWTTTPE